MKAVYNKRLLKLADLLLDNARNKKGAKFDLSLIGTVTDRTKPPAMNCGTVGCAIGLAAVSRKFRGLKATVGAYGDIELILDGQDKMYSDVAEELFGVPYSDAYTLFADGAHWGSKSTIGAEGERNVAKAIKRYVATGKLPNFK